VCLCPRIRVSSGYGRERGGSRGRTKMMPVARRTGTHAMWIAMFVGSRWYAPYCCSLASR
jgi:hypothetical protein